ncbi:MAG: PDZ domain-containing protein [Clostridia bacterium]|nr:PDZ domain-containing protein [Clostridia bacterium]
MEEKDMEKGIEEDKNVSDREDNEVKTEDAPESYANVGETGEKKAEYAFRWSYEEQEYENIKTKEKHKKGILIYAIIMTVAFVVCFAVLTAFLVMDRFPYDGDIIADYDDAGARVVIGITGGAVSRFDGAPVAGVYVSKVSEGYDAENYLEAGDIIVGIDGYEVLDVEDISEFISELDAGDTVELKVYRDGKFFDVKIELAYEK